MSAQIHNRIEADFSIKEKSGENKNLLMGRVFYDIHQHQLVYRIRFPEKGMIVINDSLITRIKNKQVVSQKPSHRIATFSIFNLCLKGDLPYYGLKNTPYKLINIEKNQNQVISTWKLPKNLVTTQGKLMLAQKNRLLQGLITFDPDGKMISKQLFEDYTSINDLHFPTRIVQFFYRQQDTLIKIVNYRNIQINNMDDEGFYNYRIPYN